MDPKDQLVLTNFPITRDVDTAYLLMNDYTRYHFPMVPYKRLLTKASELDDIHGEIAETAKRWGNILQVRGFIIPTQIAQNLTNFGLEDVRNAELLMSVPDMVAAGLAQQDPNTYEVSLVGRIGDHFFYHKYEYEINSFVPAARFANTDIILYYQASAERYRESSALLVGNH